MPTVGRRSHANIGVILGAAALAISPFLAWVHIFVFGSLNLFNLTSINGNNAEWFPVTTVLVGIVVAVIGLTRTRGGYIVTLIVGVLGGLIGLLVFIGLVSGIRQADGYVTIADGPYIGMLGLVVILVSSIVGLAAEGRT